MFKTIVGALGGEDDAAFLRPETAQGIFVNFKNVVDSSRVRVPFGIAQIGKSFRNEITPRNFTFAHASSNRWRSSSSAIRARRAQWYKYWRDRRFQWYVEHGLGQERLQLREHPPEELSHYSCGTSDIEYAFRSCPRASSASSRGSRTAATSTCAVTWKASSIRTVSRSSKSSSARWQTKVARQRQGPDLSQRPDQRTLHAARD